MKKRDVTRPKIGAEGVDDKGTIDLSTFRFVWETHDDRLEYGNMFLSLVDADVMTAAAAVPHAEFAF